MSNFGKKIKKDSLFLRALQKGYKMHLDFKKVAAN
jgi:hypothetical protein